MIFLNAASMMGEEQPKVNRCCFPLPLKICLQTWSYTKIITGLLAVITILVVITSRHDHQPVLGEPLYALLGAIAVFFIIDIGFQIASIIGIHKKSYTILRIFRYYAIMALMADCVLIPISLHATIKQQMHLKKTIIILVFGFFYILVDVIIIVKVKLEIMKIHNKYELTTSHE